MAKYDIGTGLKFISEAKIVTKKQLKKFYEKQGVNEERTQNILRILCTEKLIFPIDNSDYYVVNPMISYTEYTKKLEKSIWLFLDNMKSNIDNLAFTFNCKFPATLYMVDALNAQNDITFFYVKEGEEATMSRMINTNYDIYNESVNSIVILDDIAQISKLKLGEGIKVMYFATVDLDGKVKYYQNK